MTNHTYDHENIIPKICDFPWIILDGFRLRNVAFDIANKRKGNHA